MGLFGESLGSLVVKAILDNSSSGSSSKRSIHSGSNNKLFTTSGGCVYEPPNLINELIKESDTIVGDFYRTIDDVKEEFHELCTDGFVEMVIKGNSNYQTSFEIREKADKKIGSAQYKYEKRCTSFNKYLSELNNFINDLYEKKVALANDIDLKVQKKILFPFYKKSNYAPEHKYTESSIYKICSYLGVSGGIEIENRKESAKEYLSDAKDFEVFISQKIAEIDRMEKFLNSVYNSLEEEQILLEELNNSLHSNRKLKYATIAEQLNILIAEYILDTDGTKNQVYLQAIEQLRAMSN